MMDIMQVVEKQNEIIRIQSGAIDDLFLKLMEHISVEEADNLAVIEKINAAAKLRNELE